MAEDIFQAKGSVGGVFKGTLVAMVIGGLTAAKGSLVQSVNINYARQVSRIWELGSEDTYFVLGHTQGNAALSKIVGRQDTDVLQAMSDACQAINQVITLTSTGGGIGGQCLDDNLDFNLVITGPIMDSIGFGVNANNFLITQDASIQFAALARGSQ